MRSGHAGQLGPQPVDHLIRADLALGERLQRDVEAGGIGPAPMLPATTCNGRIAPDDVDVLGRASGSSFERKYPRGHGIAAQPAGILLREEALGNDDVEIDRQADRAQQ